MNPHQISRIALLPEIVELHRVLDQKSGADV